MIRLAHLPLSINICLQEIAHWRRQLCQVWHKFAKLIGRSCEPSKLCDVGWIRKSLDGFHLLPIGVDS